MKVFGTQEEARERRETQPFRRRLRSIPARECRHPLSTTDYQEQVESSGQVAAKRVVVFS